MCSRTWRMTFAALLVTIAYLRNTYDLWNQQFSKNTIPIIIVGNVNYLRELLITKTSETTFWTKSIGFKKSPAKPHPNPSTTTTKPKKTPKNPPNPKPLLSNHAQLFSCQIKYNTGLPPLPYRAKMGNADASQVVWNLFWIHFPHTKAKQGIWRCDHTWHENPFTQLWSSWHLYFCLALIQNNSARK